MAKQKKPVSPNQITKAFSSFDPQANPIGIYEYQLLTDAIVYGEARGVGPLSFINTLAHAGRMRPRGLRPTIVLRFNVSSPYNHNFRYDDNHEHYSGGDVTDEVAALSSLILGIRIIASSTKRTYDIHRDPMGTPVEYQDKAQPYLDVDYSRLRVPRACVDVNISKLDVLNRIQYLETDVSNALVKAARLYQQALILCETLPELAWLLMVSALETAAAQHASDFKDPILLFRELYPDIAERLSDQKEVETIVAEKLSIISKSNAKFRDFIFRFSPTPPKERPPLAFQSSFDIQEFRKAIGTIYTHRSKNLHAGVAFPAPMCDAPRYFTFPDTPMKGFQEKPMGTGSNYGGASWSAKSCPMLLHHFEYITRGALLEWWKSFDPEISTSSDDRIPIYDAQ